MPCRMPARVLSQDPRFTLRELRSSHSFSAGAASRILLRTSLSSRHRLRDEAGSIAVLARSGWHAASCCFSEIVRSISSTNSRKLSKDCATIQAQHRLRKIRVMRDRASFATFGKRRVGNDLTKPSRRISQMSATNPWSESAMRSPSAAEVVDSTTPLPSEGIIRGTIFKTSSWARSLARRRSNAG